MYIESQKKIINEAMCNVLTDLTDYNYYKSTQKTKTLGHHSTQNYVDRQKLWDTSLSSRENLDVDMFWRIDTTSCNTIRYRYGNGWIPLSRVVQLDFSDDGLGRADSYAGQKSDTALCGPYNEFCNNAICPLPSTYKRVQPMPTIPAGGLLHRIYFWRHILL